MGEETENKNCCWLFQIYNTKKKWIKLHFWHPLGQRYVFFGLVILLFTIIAAAWNRFIIISSNDYDFTISVFATTIIAIIIFYFTQEEIKRLEYSDALKKLLIEIGENKEYFDDFELKINMRYEEFKEKGKWNWIPKQNSYTNWADGNNFQHKYFKTSAYFNFVNKGFILDDEKYLKIPQGQIGNLYELFVNFNVELQKFDSIIYYFNENKTQYIINNICSEPILEEFLHLTLTYQSYNESITVSQFNNKNHPFKSEEDIINFLKCEFRNYYANEHINGGITSNYKTIKNTMIEYYDFETEIQRIKEKREKKKSS